MARVRAVLRLLVLLTRRDLRGFSSLGLNNLFFCGLFLLQGSKPQHAFLTMLPLQILLFVPLLFAMSADAMGRFPRVRMSLWPLTGRQRLVVRVAGLAFSPAFWLLGLGIALWGGVAAGLCFVALAIAVQAFVWLGSRMRRRQMSLRPIRWVPRIGGRLGGIVQVELRHLLTTLDVYAALLLAFAGSCYRFLTRSPQMDAFPILALLVALALSTYAQRSFGLSSAGELMRLRLLPVRGWKILLAKDAAYLTIALALLLPLGLLPGMTFSLFALAIGRYPAMRYMGTQRAWRFTGGSIRFGAAQILIGGLAAIGSVRVSSLFLMAAVIAYGVSVYLGGVWWDKIGRVPANKPKRLSPLRSR